ncbi:MAG: hypothetical protein LBE27_05910 [Deltaproteobacteria bacterium]|jgi:XTP/dITP diphosphohydrolase|nr:hypothetical protein [Deltaproteobacteria bacterium]
MIQFLDKLFHNRYSFPSLNTSRFKKHSSCVPFVLPDFKCKVVVGDYDRSRVAALASAIGLISQNDISFVSLEARRDLHTFRVMDPVCDGETFYQNAFIKARHYADYTQWPCIAEDHGLVVYALHGEPGVHSERYKFPQLMCYRDQERQVIQDMEGVRDRRCAYCLSICLAHPKKPEVLHWSSHIMGEIAHDLEGQGTLYQTIFYLRNIRRTLGQLSLPEKYLFSFWHGCVEQIRDDYPKIKEFLMTD